MGERPETCSHPRIKLAIRQTSQAFARVETERCKLSCEFADGLRFAAS